MTQESKVGQAPQAIQQHSSSLNLVAEYELHLRLWKLKVKIRIIYMIDANTQHILRDQQACLLCYDYWWDIWAGSGCSRWLATVVELKHWSRQIPHTAWLRPKMVLAQNQLTVTHWRLKWLVRVLEPVTHIYHSAISIYMTVQRSKSMCTSRDDLIKHRQCRWGACTHAHLLQVTW
jgi:hypothetical protein